MRTLTKSQKKIIEKYVGARQFEQNQWSCDPILDQLEAINDYETLWSDADRYAFDYLSKCIMISKM